MAGPKYQNIGFVRVDYKRLCRFEFCAQWLYSYVESINHAIIVCICLIYSTLP